VKVNTDRKRSLYIEDCFKKSQNYCSIGGRTEKLNIHLEDPVSTKTVQHELHKFNIHSKAATAIPLRTESNVKMHKRWCHKRKTWTSDNWKHACDMAPDKVDFFNPSNRTMALGSTQPLTEMSTRNLPGG
jgi:hypothetical protein